MTAAKVEFMMCHDSFGFQSFQKDTFSECKKILSFLSSGFLAFHSDILSWRYGYHCTCTGVANIQEWAFRASEAHQCAVQLENSASILLLSVLSTIFVMFTCELLIFNKTRFARRLLCPVLCNSVGYWLPNCFFLLALKYCAFG